MRLFEGMGLFEEEESCYLKAGNQKYLKAGKQII